MIYEKGNKDLNLYKIYNPLLKMEEVNKLAKEKTQPVRRFNDGALSVSVWKNTTKKDGKEIEFFTVSFQRSYKNDKDEWENTTSLRSIDVLPICELLKKAHDFMRIRETKNE